MGSPFGPFAHRITLVLLFLLLLTIGYLSQSTAMGAVQSWREYRNPYLEELKSVRRVEISHDPLAKHLVMVLLDGLSESSLLYLMEREESVRAVVSRGALLVGGKTVVPSVSYPTRATMLSGAPPEVHEVSSNWFSRRMEVDNLFAIAKERGYVLLNVGDGSIHKIVGHLLDESYPMEDGASQAAVALQKAEEVLKRRAAAGERAFLWVGITDIDTMGHKAGPYTEEYNATIIYVFSLLNSFLSSLEREGLLKESLVVVLNDHGFKRGGHHGGYEEEVRAFFMLLISPAAVPGVHRSNFDQMDVAPTISMIMGWPLPANSLGSPIGTGIRVDARRLSDYLSASRQQAISTLMALADSVGASLNDESPKELYLQVSAEAVRREALTRYAFSLLIFLVLSAIAAISLLLFYMLEGSGRRAVLLTLGAALLYELSFWAFYSFLGRPFTLSDVYSFSGYLGIVRASVLFASIVLGAAAGVRELTQSRGGFASTAALVLSALWVVTLLSLLQPLYFNAIYGVTITMPFPNWDQGFVFFLSLIREAFLGLLGAPLAMAIALFIAALSRIIR
ncbi:MAG: alkaline phosphatase family protein [Acidilobaceae archaeon]|nr:alkaline phosphatase family protein [Acidilobaceae archaeon]